MQKLIYSLDFEQRSVANQGKIVLTATREVGDDVSVDIFIDLIDPLGNYVNTKDFSSADLSVTGTSTLTWSIPTDSNGNKLRGTYTAMIYIEQTVSSPGTQSLDVSATYYFRALSNPATLQWTPICVPDNVAVLTVADSGNYSGITISSREMTLVHPAITGLADTVTSGLTIQVQPTWSNVEYYATISAEASYTEVDGDLTWHEYYDFTASGSYMFTCSTCDISSCIQEYIEGLSASANCSGTSKFNEVVELLKYEAAFRYALSCGRNADAAEWAEKIKRLTGCDCGCGGSSEPVQLTQTVVIVPTGSSLDGENVALDDIGGYFPTDNVEAALQLLAAQNAVTAWTDFENADLTGFIVGGTSPFKWRRIGTKWIELKGSVRNSSPITAGAANAFMNGYFEAQGITLEDLFFFNVMLNTNNATPEYRSGGIMLLAYSGSTDNFSLNVSADFVPAGTTLFEINALIPIA